MTRENATNGDGWHLDKKVPISIIVALLMQAAAGLWVIADIKKDVELLKDRSIVQRDRDERQDKVTAEALQMLRDQLKEMNSKLDRLIERGQKP